MLALSALVGVLSVLGVSAKKEAWRESSERVSGRASGAE